jgi:phosphoglycolate phosphatase
MEFSAILFDLDGTLLDTLADIAGAANFALERCGFPPHAVDAYRYFVGDGVMVLFSRALPQEGRANEIIESCARHFRDAYRRQWNVHTRPYPGVCELLDKLASLPLKLAVLSNKPHDATQQCVTEMLRGYRFEVVQGHGDELPRKPDPTAALKIARDMHVPPAQFVLLGDTATDMQTAIRAGMYPVGALWGFRQRDELLEHGAEIVIDHPLDLLKVLEG